MPTDVNPYMCDKCGEQFLAPVSNTTPCPKCGAPPPFVASASARIEAEAEFHATATSERILEALRLTVIGILVTLGVTVGAALGFDIGGWSGVGAGIVAVLSVPFALTVAFRNRRTRQWLAILADWAVG
jgi:hypothetical protein